jgi:hypothetical protein
MTLTVGIFHRIDAPFTEIHGLGAKYALAYDVKLPEGAWADTQAQKTGFHESLLSSIYAASGNAPDYLPNGWDGFQSTHRGAQCRSLSVGDIVTLPDGTAYTVDRVGFRRVPRGIVAEGSRMRVRYPIDY